MTRSGLYVSACLLAWAGTALSGDMDNWSHSARLTCAGYGGGESLTSFPVLVRLSPATVSGFSYGQMDDPAAGSDLRFTVDGGTPLPREIDTWNTNGESLVWVRMPVLSSAADGFDMVWGGNRAHTGSTVPWDAASVGIWHLGQTNATDSSSNRLNGQASGAVALSNGVLGAACDFTADSGYIDVGSNSVFNFGTNDFTLSAWLQSDPLADYEGLMGTYGSATKGFMLLMYNNSSNVLNLYAGGYVASPYSVPDSQWVQVAYQRAGTNAFFYMNGLRSPRYAPSTVSPGVAFHIGGGGPNWSTYRFDGRLDEVRVEAAARSSNWLWTAWFQAASNSLFMSYGPAQPRARPALGAEATTNVTTGGACFNASLLATGLSETAVTLYWGAADGGTNPAAWAATNAFAPHAGSVFPAPYSQPVTFDPGAYYYHRFMAANAAGSVWETAMDPVMAGEVTLQAADAVGSETGKSVTVTLVRPGWSTNLPLTVSYSLSGSAQNGADYASLSGVAVFPAGQAQVPLTVIPTNDYVYEGSETVVLSISPGPYAVGASNTATVTIQEANKVVYVATNGAAVPPFGTWANAATTIQDAVDAAAVGDTVRVGDGTYTGRGTGAAYTSCVALTKNVRVESANGPAAVIVDAKSVANQRGLVVSNAPNAVVSGITFRRGKVNGTYDHGGGAWMMSGTLTNCVFRDNYANGYGGGIYMKTGLVVDCLVASNLSVEHSYGAGGGIYVAGGEVACCRILTNECRSSAGAGGLYLADGLVRNCLVAFNYTIRNEDGNYSPGGGIRMVKGSVVYSTIVSNYSETDGGGIYMAAGGVTNCIVTDNRSGPHAVPGGTNRNIARIGGTVGYTCASPLQPGAGNLDALPVFMNPASDFRLAAGSPCRDAASPDAASPRDLAGQARPVDGNGDGTAAADLGAYEAGSVTTGALQCSFTAAGSQGLRELAVVLAASAAGADTNPLYLKWDFNKGRSPAMAAEGWGLGVVSTNFGPGWYTVELTASNGAGQTARYEVADFIKVAPEVAYVATNGGHVAPFQTPANAATSIVAAVLAAGDAPGTGTVVLVAPGVYRTSESVVVDKGIRLVGEGGPDVTLVQTTGSTYRTLFVSHPDARVEGLSLRGPSSVFANWGGALRLNVGTVSNCVIRDTKIVSRGGGVYVMGGLLTHSVIASNGVTEWQNGYGGGLFLAGGRVQYTLFASNCTWSRNGGAGVYMTGGTLRNCLLTNNAGLYKTSPDYSKGGAINLSGGLVESCTIADNFSEGPGGGIYMTGGAVTNTVLYYNAVDPRNAASLANLARVPDGAGTVGHSCASPLPDGTNNVFLDPAFLNRAGGDYRLSPASPCVNAGTNQAWMGGAPDLAGSPRIETAVADIGAYETPDASAGPLVISFSTPVTAGYTNLEAVFTASAVGSDSNLTHFWWDFNVGGSPAAQLEGTNLWVVTNAYPAGQFSVRLIARNESGEFATNLQERLLLVSPEVIYVATNGTPVVPYMTWDTAAASLHDAVPVAGGDEAAHSTILVGPGLYSNVSPVNIAKPVTIRGTDGPAATVLRHTTGRILYLNHPQAFVCGLTLANGRLTSTTDQGAGILLENGTVSNCVIRDCSTPNQGGGVHVKAGLLTDCLVVSNAVTEWQYGYGGGIFISSGVVDRCVVVSNVTRSHRGGGGIYMTGGAVRNSLVTRNEALPTGNAGYFGDAGGVLLTGGRLEHCTVAFNTASTNCGGVIIEGNGGGVTNCIVVCNQVTNVPAPAQDFLNTVRTGFTCSPDVTNGLNGNITAGPVFVSTNDGDFRLERASPCREAGTNLGWTAGATDLGGRPRKLGRQPDMGAYEADAPRNGLLLTVY